MSYLYSNLQLDSRTFPVENNEKKLNLYMVLLGCKPEGRNTEQHDVFFGVAEKLRDLIPAMRKFWPVKNLHIDVWAKVDKVGSHDIEIIPKGTGKDSDNLYFINLGGYKEHEFEEYHQKLLYCCENMAQAIEWAKATDFYTEGQRLEGELLNPRSHVDDKFDVDDIINVADVIPDFKEKYEFFMKGYSSITEYPKANIGYLKFSLLETLDV
jgi:hypothetical protein